MDGQNRQNNSAESKNQYEKNSRNSRETIAKFYPNEKVTISMTKDKFDQHIIEMIVENGIPLTFFSLTRLCLLYPIRVSFENRIIQ